MTLLLGDLGRYNLDPLHQIKQASAAFDYTKKILEASLSIEVPTHGSEIDNPTISLLSSIVDIRTDMVADVAKSIDNHLQDMTPFVSGTSIQSIDQLTNISTSFERLTSNLLNSVQKAANNLKESLIESGLVERQA